MVGDVAADWVGVTGGEVTRGERQRLRKRQRPRKGQSPHPYTAKGAAPSEFGGKLGTADPSPAEAGFGMTARTKATATEKATAQATARQRLRSKSAPLDRKGCGTRGKVRGLENPHASTACGAPAYGNGEIRRRRCGDWRSREKIGARHLFMSRPFCWTNLWCVWRLLD